MFFDNFITANVGGGLLSVQRANDFADRQHSTGGAADLDARRDDAERAARAVCDARAEPRRRTRCRAPARRSTSPASRNFGGPIAAVSDAGFGFTQNVLQVNNNFDAAEGQPRAQGRPRPAVGRRHARLAAGAALHLPERRRRTWRAQDGANRLGYTSFTQYFGLPDLEYNTAQYGLFVQDDWRVSSDLKVLYGVRYDLYDAARCRSERAGRDLARVPDVEQQLRAARSARCGRSARASGPCCAPTPA